MLLTSLPPWDPGKRVKRGSRVNTSALPRCAPELHLPNGAWALGVSKATSVPPCLCLTPRFKEFAPVRV